MQDVSGSGFSGVVMKHQLCRNCGHRHPLGDPCIFPEDALSGPEVSVRSTNVSPADTSGQESPVRPSAPSVTISTSNGLTTTSTVVMTEEEMVEKIERGEVSLTNADRCRRWRTSGDVEAKREANKLRMRKRRVS